MKRNFECLSCHHKFESDDNMEVACPKCSSDNVKPIGKSINKSILYSGVFFVALIVGFIVIKSIKSSEEPTSAPVVDYEPIGDGGGSVTTDYLPTNEPAEEEQQSKKIDLEKLKIEKEAEKVPVKQPVTIAITTPKADGNGTYSFTARAEHVPSGVSVKAYNLTKLNGEVIASNQNGKFSGVSYSSEKGQYNLIVELSDGQEITKDRIGGFDKVEIVDNRMQADELTRLLNARDRELGLGRNSKVLRSPKIVVNSSDANDQTQINMIDDIYGRLELGAWSHVTVTSVEYDSKGRINKFTIDIN